MMVLPDVTLADVIDDITLAVMPSVLSLWSLGAAIGSCVVTSSVACMSPVVTLSTTPVVPSLVGRSDAVLASLPAATLIRKQ